MADAETTEKRRTRPPAIPKKFTPRFWGELDNRFAIAKEVSRRYETLKADTGADQSAQRDMLAQRAVFLGVLLETMEVEAMESGHLDAGPYVQATNALQGLLKCLGLDRKAVSTQNLAGYLAEKKKK